MVGNITPYFLSVIRLKVAFSKHGGKYGLSNIREKSREQPIPNKRITSIDSIERTHSVNPELSGQHDAFDLDFKML